MFFTFLLSFSAVALLGATAVRYRRPTGSPQPSPYRSLLAATAAAVTLSAGPFRQLVRLGRSGLSGLPGLPGLPGLSGRAGSGSLGRRRLVGEAGQTTAEYALVLVGAAALALLLIGWATKTDAVGKLFDFVLQQIKGRVS